jgi:hypothetical protein
MNKMNADKPYLPTASTLKAISVIALQKVAPT